MTDVTVAEQTGTEVDLYAALGLLDRGATTEEIRGSLRILEVQNRARASRAGATGADARAMLALVDRAKVVFADDDSRMAYDLRLRQTPEAGEAAEPIVDWRGRAWNYYYLQDEGAAGVAARKAREQDPNSAMAFVVSAWVSLLQGDLRQATRESDEAFVLDELAEDTADVHHVRGAVFYSLGAAQETDQPLAPGMMRVPDPVPYRNRQYARALKSFDRALMSASPQEAAEIRWRKALVWEKKEDYRTMYAESLGGLSTGAEMTDFMQQRLVTTLCRAVDLEFRQATPHKEIEGLATYEKQISRSAVPGELRRPVLAYLKTATRRAKKISELDDLKGKGAPFGAEGGAPVKILIAAAVVLVLAQIWAILYFLVAGAVAWAAYAFYMRKEWREVQQRIQQLRKEIGDLNREIAARIDLPIDRESTQRA